MKKDMKKKLVLLALSFIVVSSVLRVGAVESISSSCNGEQHWLPILKDEWKAWTTITMNGVYAESNVTADKVNEAMKTCYTYTTIEAWGSGNSYDNGYKSLYGWDAVDPGITTCFAKASVRGVKKVESTHLGRNSYTYYDLTERLYWNK